MIGNRNYGKLHGMVMLAAKYLREMSSCQLMCRNQDMADAISILVTREINDPEIIVIAEARPLPRFTGVMEGMIEATPLSTDDCYEFRKHSRAQIAFDLTVQRLRDDFDYLARLS